MEAQKVNKKVCGDCYNYDYDGYVFIDELGNRMKKHYLTCQFPKFIEKHGMQKMQFHAFRYLCASLLLANGEWFAAPGVLAGCNCNGGQRTT